MLTLPLTGPSRSVPADSEVPHGQTRLPSIDVVHYNAELRDGGGFAGDRASKKAFQAILDRLREPLRALGQDPLGDVPTDEIGKKTLDRLLVKGAPEAAGLVVGAIEAFAVELAGITVRLLGTPGWRGVERIAVGGGLRASRVGELAIGRASVMVKAWGHATTLRPVRHHPDEAGLVGSAHLVPLAKLAGHDAFLAVDIGGSNIRVGLVELNLRRAPDLRRARVTGLDLWRHCDDDPSRDEAIDRLGAMLRTLHGRARRERLDLAPFVGVGCPGAVEGDGTIDRGAQNLPGDWEGDAFNLPERIRAALPDIDGQPTEIVMHNDAIVQGLSEAPWMQDVSRWGVLTIGTGLGNACFLNRGRP